MTVNYQEAPRACVRCLYTTWHPLGLVLDKEGVCSGCRVHEEKQTLDWEARWKQLESLISGYRRAKGDNYDCIVPVSGARDSFFIVHMVKKLDLKPLLVTYNKLYNTELGIRNLARLRTVFDCDLVTFTVNPDTVKKLTRASLRRLGSVYWHCLAGQTVFPAQCAVRFHVPLIIWGAHQGLDQVGMFSHLHDVEMTRRYRKDHDLMGVEAEDLVSEFDHVKSGEVEPFVYPSYSAIRAAGVRGIYLGNYLPWDTKRQHEEMLRFYQYEAAPLPRTFDTCNDVDSFVYSDVHDYLKFIKHGYGKVLDHAVRELRWGRLTREEASELVRKYQTREAERLDLFLNWIGMSERAFRWVADQHRNPALWERDTSWQWRMKRDLLTLPVDGAQREKARLEFSESARFPETPSKRPEYSDAEYVCIGRGVPCGR
ncbi:MAG: N-acetyl sugar amidotransferase [Chthoniobacter sp.]|nr:N-acetyl sugar amidotransferase [Chthoniobacter sp.]